MEDGCIHGLDSLPRSIRNCVLTIGSFDGVHVGHRRIIQTGRSLADKGGAALVAMTFDPLPEQALYPKHAPPRISTLDQKVRLLRDYGCDCVVIVAADRDFLATPPEVFIDRIVVGRFAPSHVVEGPDFFFGAGRAGSDDTLCRAASTGGFEMHVVDPVFVDSDQGRRRVSSSLIRSLIAAGGVDQAAVCLGRPLALLGRVKAGTGRGRTLLGFPTVNLAGLDQIIPGDGIYAGRASIDGRDHAAAISIGINPTLGGKRRTVEAFLLDAAGDFRNRPITLTFIRRMRDQRRFETIEALKAAIAEDVEHVRQILS